MGIARRKWHKYIPVVVILLHGPAHNFTSRIFKESTEASPRELEIASRRMVRFEEREQDEHN